MSDEDSNLVILNHKNSLVMIPLLGHDNYCVQNDIDSKTKDTNRNTDNEDISNLTESFEI